MNYSWDEAKRAANLVKHGYYLADAQFIDWDRAVTYPDLRFDYGEARMIALGLLWGRLCAAVYVERGGGRRIISLRKANKREQRIYEQETENRAG